MDNNRKSAEDMPVALTAQERVAMTNPKHLKLWLRDTGRHFLVLKHDDLVDALPWPEGVEAMIQLVEAYRQHRAVEVGEEWPCAKCGGAGELRNTTVPTTCPTCAGAGVGRRYKTDLLELDEAKAAVEWLMVKIREKEPTWQP